MSELIVPCCDVCNALVVNLCLETRPITPELTTAPEDAISSAQSTPARVPNRNGKRRMAPGTGARREERLAACKGALMTWRDQTWRQLYSKSDFMPSELLPDTHLATIARGTHIVSMTDLEHALNKPWAFISLFGQDILELVRNTDQHWLLARQQEVEIAKATKAVKTKCKKVARVALRQQTKQQERRDTAIAQPQDMTQSHSVYTASNQFQPAQYYPSSESSVLQSSLMINVNWDTAMYSVHPDN